MNVLEFLKDTISPFVDGKKPPLHVGEVMNLWFYLTATEQTLRGEQVSFNVVTDSDLRDKIKDVIQDVHLPIREDLQKFLKEEGVPLPITTPDKPLGEFRQIPDNVKLNDNEVANLLSFNLVLGINYACRGMTEAVRPDVASMFAKYQMKKAAFSVSFRQLMVEKGWMMLPPYYNQAAVGNGE